MGRLRPERPPAPKSLLRPGSPRERIRPVDPLVAHGMAREVSTMGLLDRMKEQAATATATATAKAKDAAQRGQAKLDALQASRAADALLRDLGAAVFAERSGRGDPGTEERIQRTLDALRAHEREHGPIDLGPKPAGWGGAADS